MQVEALLRLAHVLLVKTVWLLAIVVMGGLISATLVRHAPGFGVDERELDSRRSAESIQAIREERSSSKNIVNFYAQYLGRMLSGDFGQSQTFERPIGELLRERLKISFHSLAVGTAVSWALVLGIAVGFTGQHAFPKLLSILVGAALMAIPSGMIALWAASSGRGVAIALVMVLSPPLYKYVRNILDKSYLKMHVTAARALGISNLQLLTWHVLPIAAPQLIGLIGVTVSMAFGALIPLEFICDSPGIGQLALEAALGRDLPLLVTLTMCVTLATLVANTLADVANAAIGPRTA